jgi:hypothetical protein
MLTFRASQALLETDVQSAYESMENSDKLSFSNALWQCGISFSNAKYDVHVAMQEWHVSHLFVAPLSA